MRSHAIPIAIYVSNPGKKDKSTGCGSFLVTLQPGHAPALQSRIRHAYFWTIIGNTTRYAATLGISLLLARLLKPEDYGLIGMIIVFTELLGSILDSCVGPAVVHFDERNAGEERSTYFTASLILGALFTVLLLAGAPLIARFYREPRLIPLLRVMSVLMLVSSVKTVSGGILTRELRFRELSYSDIFASLAAGVVAIVMASRGFGVWSLVANQFLFILLTAVAYGWWVRPQFRLPLNREITSRLWRYGAPLTGSSLLFKFYDNADYLVVGRVLGSEALGFYSVAFRLAMLINERISSVINRVAFPSFANLKDDTPKVIGHWFAVSKRVTLLTFPLLVWLGFNAQDFILVALGARWLPAALPLQFLCVMTAVKILTNIVGQVLIAVGYPAVAFRYDLLNAIALPVAFLVGCKMGGLLGVGIAWCTVFPLLRFLFLLGAKRQLHFSLRAYARNMFDPMMVSVACGLLMAPVAWMLQSGWIRLGVRSLLWLAAVLLCAAVSRNVRKLIGDTLTIFSSAKLSQP